MAQGDWQHRLTRVVADEVRRYRKLRKMSAQELASRCADIGFPIPRPVLSNLENGRREAVSIAELLVLAFALDVHPAQLIFPLGYREIFEVLPGQPVLTETAIEWFIGETELIKVGPTLAVGQEPPPTSPIALYRAHEAAQREWLSTDRKIRQLVEQDRRDEARLVMENLAQIEGRLRQYRALIRERALLPPYVRPELARIDDPEPAQPDPDGEITDAT